MPQHATDEELHVAVGRVQANMRMCRCAYALERLRMQRRAEIVQTGYLRNRLARLK